jgi:hypothetical protein
VNYFQQIIVGNSSRFQVIDFFHTTIHDFANFPLIFPIRNVLGTRNLSELLIEREAIAHTMQASLDEATDPWGFE